MKLPEMAVLLIRLIGQHAALRMMEPANYGGKNYTVPKGELGRGEQNFAALAETVGMENAKRLCQNFGGDDIYVPLLTKMQLAERNRAIVAAYNSNVSVWKLASDNKMSDRQIQRILKTTDMNVDNDKLMQAVAAQRSLF
jgi:Mor family transcriptional regulator